MESPKHHSSAKVLSYGSPLDCSNFLKITNIQWQISLLVEIYQFIHSYLILFPRGHKPPEKFVVMIKKKKEILFTPVRWLTAAQSLESSPFNPSPSLDLPVCLSVCLPAFQLHATGSTAHRQDHGLWSSADLKLPLPELPGVSQVPGHAINLGTFKLIVLKCLLNIYLKKRLLVLSITGKMCPWEILTTSAPQIASMSFLFPTHIFCFLRIVLQSTASLYPYNNIQWRFSTT